MPMALCREWGGGRLCTLSPASVTCFSSGKQWKACDCSQNDCSDRGRYGFSNHLTFVSYTLLMSYGNSKHLKC